MSGTQIEHYVPVSVPLTPLSTFMGRWVFGEALCKLLPASQVIRNVGNHDCNSKSYLFLMRIGCSLVVFLFSAKVNAGMSDINFFLGEIHSYLACGRILGQFKLSLPCAF